MEAIRFRTITRSNLCSRSTAPAWIIVPGIFTNTTNIDPFIWTATALSPLKVRSNIAFDLSVLVRRNMSHSRGSDNASLYGSSPKENQLLPPPSPLRSPQQPGSFRFQRRENSIVRRRGLMGQHSFNCPRTSCTTGAFRRRESSAYASCAANSGKPPLPTFLSRRNTITVGVHTNPPLSLRGYLQAQPARLAPQSAQPLASTFVV